MDSAEAAPAPAPSCAFARLPIPALERIFSYLPHPQAMSLVNREVYLLSKSTTLRALWFLTHWGRTWVLSRAAIESLHGGAILDDRVLPAILAGGAFIGGDDYYVVKWAADHAYLRILHALLDGPLVPQAARDRALGVGALNGNLAVAQLALHHGANPNANHGYALRYAAYRLHLPVVKLLLQHGAVPDRRSLGMCFQRLNNYQSQTDLAAEGHADPPTGPPPDLDVLVETVRWLVWYGAPEDLAEQLLKAKEMTAGRAMDAAGSLWFATRPPRAEGPPNNPLNVAAGAGVPPPPPTAAAAPAVVELDASETASVASDASASEHGSDVGSVAELEEEEPFEPALEGMTEALRTVYPFSRTSSSSELPVAAT
ncbi:hypothetical protein H9P43_007734 [Blastocladiella emersonii ATCC 22665]|nr:hypothetical protein H9P43_007734 [Blastocladiella emersonii ATCC 22665]